MDSTLISQTMIIIALTCFISVLGFYNEKLRNRLLLWSVGVRRWQFDRFITYGFVHGDGAHLLLNMITLYFFGSITEPFFNHHLGTFGFSIFYLLALIVSIFPSYMHHRKNIQYRSLGASGAVSAVLFSAILMQPWQMLYVYVIPMPAIIFGMAYIAYSIYAAKKNQDHINHTAHLAGIAFGILFSIYLQPSLVSAFIHHLFG